MKDLGLKALSLGIALLLAFFVQSDGNSSQAGFVVPIQLQAVPKGRVLVSPLRPEVQVTVRGPSFLVSQMLSSNRVVTLTLPAALEDRFLVTLDRHTLNIPPSVQLVGVTPSEIEFRIEDLLSKTVPVEIPQLGRLNPELELVALQLDPNSVTIQGPATEVTKVTRIESEPIDLRDIASDETRTLNLRIPGKLLELSQRTIAASITIRERTSERRLSGVPIVVGPESLARRFHINPKSVSVQFTGKAQLVRGVSREQFRATVTLPDSAPPGQELPIVVEGPEGITIVDVEPSRASVVLNRGTASRK